MIKLDHIQKRYTMGGTVVHALADVSVEIMEGDFVAIMGPSGSGKSTLMNVLGLLDVPDSGTYAFYDKLVSNLSEDQLASLRGEIIGFIFQQFNLLPRMSAQENVALPMLYSNKAYSMQKTMPLIERVGLEKRFFHKPNELSGGQQQRVAIARALINQPRMILADEPTGNLDSTNGKEIMKFLHDLNEQGLTIVLVTHEESIGQQAKRLIRMRDGRIESDERLRAIGFQQAAVTNKMPQDILVRKKITFKDTLEYLSQGFKTLLMNKVRSGLSMLGIMIGVGAVVAMLALGQGAQQAITTQLQSLGSNLLILRAGSIRIGGVAQESGTVTRLTLEDADAIKERIPTVTEVAPSISNRAQVTFADKNWSTQVLGTTLSYEKMRSTGAALGRFFTAEESQKRARVALLGKTVVRELFGSQSPIGEYVKINKINFMVIGVLQEKGSSGWRDQDDTIIIPVLTAMYRLMGKNYIENIDLQLSSLDEIEEVSNSILNLMYSRHKVAPSQKDTAFQIMNMSDLQSALSQSTKTMSMLLAIIAAISLFVGGIGIMNIMLVSVTERTKEIGLRKAIGARRQDILFQFLSESVVVSTIGGVLGIILGASIAVGLAWFAGWTTAVSVSSIALAFTFSAGVGVVFGIYPAQKASKLHPIQALRYE